MVLSVSFDEVLLKGSKVTERFIALMDQREQKNT